MGELIRNLHEIEIGNEKMMIELNEGYSKSQGRVIHIQNKDFRYLIQEREFLQLATTILRAKSEMDYYKTNMLNKKAKEVTGQNTVPDENTTCVLLLCTEFLKKNEVDYRIVEVGEGYITLIIAENNYHHFRRSIKMLKGIKKKEHIYGKKFGYSFIYQMKPFDLYTYKEVFLEVFYQLPCMSLTPFMWLPLDRIIQQRIWSEKDFDENGICWLDDISLYIYKLCWAIFKKGFFSEKDKKILADKAEVISTETFDTCIEKVFFKYSKRVKKMLEEKRFDDILRDYITYSDY